MSALACGAPYAEAAPDEGHADFQNKKNGVSPCGTGKGWARGRNQRYSEKLSDGKGEILLVEPKDKGQIVCHELEKPPPLEMLDKFIALAEGVGRGNLAIVFTIGKSNEVIKANEGHRKEQADKFKFPPIVPGMLSSGSS